MPEREGAGRRAARGPLGPRRDNGAGPPSRGRRRLRRLRRPAAGRLRPRVAHLCAALTAVLIIAGALIWLVPFLTRERAAVTGVVAAPALATITPFTLSPGGEACMSDVTIDARSGAAELMLEPSKPGTPLPPVELLLSATGYRSVSTLPAGAPAGAVVLPVSAPARAVIGSACFLDRGKTAVALDGTAEARTVSRSPMTVEGRSVVGDIALTFYRRRPQPLIDRLGEVLGHASNLTEGLVPLWLVWIIAALVAFGVPIGIVWALYLALRYEEDGSSRRAAPATPAPRPTSASRAADAPPGAPAT